MGPADQHATRQRLVLRPLAACPGSRSGLRVRNHPSWTSPHLDRAQIEAERDRLPDRVFRQEYGGEFIEGSGAVFRNVRESATGAWEEPKKDAAYWAGLDLARVVDFTVLVVVDRDRNVVFVDRFHKLDWSLQVTRIEAAVRRFNGAQVLVDSTARASPSTRVSSRPASTSTRTRSPRRSKAALIDNLSLMLGQREMVLPKVELWPEGIDELEAFEYSITDQGNVRTSAPSGVHDDCVIALALAAWQVKDRATDPEKHLPW